MSRSRFVLKQIPVGGSGQSDLARYVSRSKLDPEKEGRAGRPLWSAHEDQLSATEARRWLSIVGDKWDKKDALHYVFSFASQREYELLGADETERRAAVREFLRAALKDGLKQLGVGQARWVAGVHRNTGNPHLHLLLNRNALRERTGELIRLERLPVPLVGRNRESGEGSKVFFPGEIITAFAARVDERHRERARFLAYDSPLQTVSLRRELVPAEELRRRGPNEAERLVGQWLRAEVATTQRQQQEPSATTPPGSVPGARDRSIVAVGGLSVAELRNQVAQLDQRARENGQAPVAAYLSAAQLRELLLLTGARANRQPLVSVSPPVTERIVARTAEHELPDQILSRASGPHPPTKTEPALTPPTHIPTR